MSRDEVNKELHELDLALQSTVSNLEDFKESVVWQDMSTYIKDSVEVLHVLLEKATTIEQVKFIQGQLDNCRLMLDWPDRTIQELETQTQTEG